MPEDMQFIDLGVASEQIKGTTIPEAVADTFCTSGTNLYRPNGASCP